MTDLEHLQTRLDHWQRRMRAGTWHITLELLPEPEEGVWGYAVPHADGIAATLRVNAEMPDELLDWVFVRLIAELLVSPMEEFLRALTILQSAEQRFLWRSELNQRVERLVQEMARTIIGRDEPLLIEGWFAGKLVEYR
jgi:hypothetical protein